MQFVCDDINLNSKWFYEPDMERYVRTSKTGQVISQIGGAYLPDPKELLDVRGRVAQVATVKLWEHWNSL